MKRTGLRSEGKRKEELRQILLIASRNFFGWGRNVRIWMTFFLGLVLCLMLSDQIIFHARIYEAPIQILEPFIWTFGDSESILLASLLLLLLFADMPFVDATTPAQLIRTKRWVWLSGQILYVALATCVFNLFLMAAETAMSAPWAYTGNVWSETAAGMAYGRKESVTIPVSVRTMEISTPFECAVQVFLLMLLYSLFLASFMLFFNLLRGNAAGAAAAVGVDLYGILLTPDILERIVHFPSGLAYRANVLCGWLSPLNHAAFPMHSFGYDHLPKIWMSAAFFVIFILLFCFLAWRRMRKYSFTFVQTEG